MTTDTSVVGLMVVIGALVLLLIAFALSIAATVKAVRERLK